MRIEFNKVTWYSKMIAVIVFIGTFFVAFYLGKEFGEIRQIGYETPIGTASTSITNTFQPSASSIWKQYENKDLLFSFVYPTVVWGGPQADKIPVGIYEDKENGIVYIGNQNTISDYLGGRAMYLPPVSVVLKKVNSYDELDDFIKEFGSACKLDQKGTRRGDVSGDYFYNITVTWEPSTEGPPDCAMSDANYKVLHVEKNNGDKIVNVLIISRQECAFPDLGYENTGVCYDQNILDSFDFIYR